MECVLHGKVHSLLVEVQHHSGQGKQGRFPGCACGISAIHGCPREHDIKYRATRIEGHRWLVLSTIFFFFFDFEEKYMLFSSGCVYTRHDKARD
jgi:hypothetical protein